MSRPVPLYQLKLEDYATPAFYSGSKPYFGTEKQILRLLARREDGELCEAARRYFGSEGDGVAHLLYWTEKIISPVERLGWTSFRFDDLSVTFLNIWDCPYRLRTQRVEGKLHYLRREDGVCFRALQAVFTGLEMADRGLPALPAKELPPFWGYPDMIFRRGNALKSRLFLTERRFDSQEAALADLAQPTPPCFDPFFEDIFGDG